MNKFQVSATVVDKRPMVKIGNPVHGPITPDDALDWAAHLAVASGKPDEISKRIKAIQKGQGK